MELRAAIEALTYLNTDYEVEMFTDSRYLELGITYWIDRWLNNNWQTSRNGSVKNIAFWQELVDAEYSHASVNWNWVRGHSRDEHNDRADYLARRGCDYAVDILNSGDYWWVVVFFSRRNLMISEVRSGLKYLHNFIFFKVFFLFCYF